MLAVAMSHGARLLILDEPTSGLDPVARDELIDILGDFMRDEKNGVLFSTHITTDLEKVADYITFIVDGNIKFTGEKDKLLETYLLIKGSPAEITSTNREKIIGYREHSVGFEGMINVTDKKSFSGNLVFEKVNLDEIIVFMNRGRGNHE